MMTKHLRTLFVVNPTAAQGALHKAWESLAKGLKGTIRKFEFAFTRERGDATRIVRQGLSDGFEMLVAVGGDGTLNECVNGFFKDKQAVNPRAVLGILPFGRGSDFARGLGFERLPEHSIKRLGGSSIRMMDVGCVHFGAHDTRYFLNIANIGLVPHVVNFSHSAPKFLGASGTYVYGAIRAMMTYQPGMVTLEDESGKKITRKLLNLVIANGTYFGAGMKIAPMAQLDDGFFDVLLAGPMPLYRYLRHFPELYSGHHLKLPNISCFKAKKIKISSVHLKHSFLVELDGDTVGKTPVTFEILPKALQFKV